MRILLVEDERMTRVALTRTLGKEGHEIVSCENGSDALAALGEAGFDLVLTDLNLPGPDGLEILRAAVERHPAPRVIIMTAYASTETAVKALRSGAYDYIIKPFQTDEILARIRNIDLLRGVEQENRRLKEEIAGARQHRIVGNSRCMKELDATISSIAPGEYNVLIQGPSGTGKELAARAVHDRSARRDGPFVAVNCSAIPDSLIDSELFGYRKGAFTGANRDHEGYIARSDGGSLFLDEIDDLPPAVQVKLLRVIQEREVEPIGGSAPRSVDFRLISATKKDLKSLAETGEFRDDLYYRLNVIPLILPTLAERKEDIPDLVRHFAMLHGKRDSFELTRETYEALMAHDWPGNVRELGNVVERMLAMPDVPVRQLMDERAPARNANGQRAADPIRIEIRPGTTLDYRAHMQQCEESLLRWAVEEAGGNISTAARLLGLPRSTLRSKLERLDS